MEKMLDQLNGCLLNQVVNATLFLVLAVIYVITLLDRRFSSQPRDRHFSMFILFSAIYVGMHVVWLTAVETGAPTAATDLLRFERVLSAFAAYCFIGLWLLACIQDKSPVKQSTTKALFAIVIALFVLSVLLATIARNAALANIPILAYYILLECLVLYFRKPLGKSSTVIITLLIVPTLALQAQEYWNYTPANIYIVLITLVVYSRMWTEQKQQHLEEQRLLAEQRAELENAQTKLVLSQIKPHFLYNTLGTIAYLCDDSPEDAKALTLDFSSYLRGNLSTLDGGKLIPFKKELDHVKTYLGIELVRFSDTLTVEYSIRATDFKLPALTVEPLVENAVKHGICQREGGGTIIISSSEEVDCFTITVFDNGLGFDASSFEGNDPKHIGIRSVRTRIETLAGGTLSIKSSPDSGTTATLKIPKPNLSNQLQ